MWKTTSVHIVQFLKFLVPIMIIFPRMGWLPARLILFSIKIHETKMKNLPFDHKKINTFVFAVSDEPKMSPPAGRKNLFWSFQCVSINPKAIISLYSTLVVLLDNKSALVNWIINWICSVNSVVTIHHWSSDARFIILTLSLFNKNAGN